jgi:hypothetical protein
MKNLTPVLVIGGVVLLFLFMRKKQTAAYASTAVSTAYPVQSPVSTAAHSVGSAVSAVGSALAGVPPTVAAPIMGIAKLGVQTAVAIPVATTKAGIAVVKSVGSSVVSTGSSIIHGIGSIF